MKKIFCILLVFLFVHRISAQSITLEETRKRYAKSSQNKEDCESLYKRLSDTDTKNKPVMSCYLGAITATMANYVKEPAEKLKYFKAGRKLIDKAVMMDSLNAEIRFIRFTIQTNVPKAVHYDKQIETDKFFLISHLPECKDTVLQKNMAAYLAGSKNLDEEEKEKVKKITEKN